MFVVLSIAYFYLLCCCCALEFSNEKYPDSVECDNYFHGKPWPQLKGASKVSTVKLCQTQQQKDSSMTLDSTTSPIYATLFDTFHRTPVYSANKVTLAANKTVLPRPDRNVWNRVAVGLCKKSIPKFAIDSNLEFVNESTLSLCKGLQAVNTDYYDNKLDLDRGHLSPNHINSRNKVKQLATFTLTNAAPQFANFNRHSWRIYECVTEFMIIKLVPHESVFILTGVYGSALDKSGKDIWLHGHAEQKRVKVPGYYWKAVCYPGNKRMGKDPWGYAIVKKNVDKKVYPDYQSYITLKEFAQKYFEDPPFGPDCMNAGFGEFKTVFSDWDNYINTYCNEPW